MDTPTPPDAHAADAGTGGSMRVLTLNAGSATLKFAVGETRPGDAAGEVTRIARGVVDRVGETGRLRAEVVERPGDPVDRAGGGDGTGDAVDGILDWLDEVTLLPTIDAVGHRVVHGGPDLTRPTEVDASVLRRIEAASSLAPLHNRPALDCLGRATTVLGDRPHVAVFDTGFHTDLPERARTYPVPPAVARRHGLRRYGFHGLAHRWMWERWLGLSGAAPESARAVTLQLGSGCSAAAVEAGRCVDTSMGTTPLEGLMMRTRAGSIDPALVALIAAREDRTADEVVELLNRESGLLAVGGHDGDVSRLLDAEAGGDAAAGLALEMFCYRITKQVGAYLAALGGADAIVVGGGVGENAPAVRSRALRPLAWCGVEIDDAANEAASGSERRISTAASPVAVWVVPVDEAAVVTVEVRDALGVRRATTGR